MQKELRPKITINGQPTAELDYSGCAIRMLYHVRNLDCPGDPYFLPPIYKHGEERGLNQGDLRDDIKALTQALVNGKEGGRPAQIPLPKGGLFQPAYTRHQVIQMIAMKHRPIADAFGTGAGLWLQRRESDLALAIITTLREQGIPALPVHDSFIVATDNRELLIPTCAETDSHQGFPNW